MQQQPLLCVQRSIMVALLTPSPLLLLFLRRDAAGGVPRRAESLVRAHRGGARGRPRRGGPLQQQVAAPDPASLLQVIRLCCTKSDFSH